MRIKKPLFVRKDAKKKIRFGIKRKIKWRRQKGRDSKIRQKMKGYPKMPNIGYGTQKSIRGLIENKKPILIYNLEDLKKTSSKDYILVAHISMKNKIEIAKFAKEKGIKINNLNLKKTLRKEKIKQKIETKKENK